MKTEKLNGLVSRGVRGKAKENGGCKNTDLKMTQFARKRVSKESARDPKYALNVYL